MKEKIQPVIFISMLVYLSCYFLQLFKFPDILMLGIGACFCLWLLIKQKRIRVSFGLCLLAATMFPFCLIQFGTTAIFARMIYIILLMWIFAEYLGADLKTAKNGEVKLIYVIYSLILGHLIYGILNSYMYFAGTGVPGTRYWFDIWSQELTPGTQLTMYFISVFAGFFPAVVWFKNRKWVNIIIIVGSCFLIYVSLATRTRTTLLVLVIVCIVQFVLVLILEKEKVRLYTLGKKLWIVVVIGVVGMVVGIVLIKDTQIIRAFIDNLNKGGGILNNVRFTAQRAAISQLFDHPMGGRKMDLGLLYCHNVWLDMANASGIVPFVAFTGFTLYTGYNLVRFVLEKDIQTETKLIMTGMYVAFFLYYTVEPALDSSVHFITPWILVNGLIKGYMSKEGR